MADAMADDTSDQTPAFNSLLDNSGDGLVVSAVLETTHYGLAFPEDSTVLPIFTPHLSALISDGALVFRCVQHARPPFLPIAPNHTGVECEHYGLWLSVAVGKLLNL